MQILIDGNNLLCNLYKTDRVTQELRQAFIKTIQAYMRIKSHNIILFFDGGLYNYPIKSRLGLLTIVDAGTKQTADDVIISWCLELPDKQVVVVTSDRSLQKKIQSTRAIVITSQQFGSRLTHALRDTSRLKKIEGIITQWGESKDTELDELMRQAAKKITTSKVEDKELNLDRTTIQKKGKKERSVQSILDRL